MMGRAGGMELFLKFEPIFSFFWVRVGVGREGRLGIAVYS